MQVLNRFILSVLMFTVWYSWCYADAVIVYDLPMRNAVFWLSNSVWFVCLVYLLFISFRRRKDQYVLCRVTHAYVSSFE